MSIETFFVDMIGVVALLGAAYLIYRERRKP